MIKGDAQLKKYATNYYKYLFGAPDVNCFSMFESQKDDIPKVSMEENNFLTKEFTEEEVKHVVFQMEHKKAPGLDGFPAELIEHKGK